MNVNPNGLLPALPNLSCRPKPMRFYRLLKSVLLSLVLLGGLYLVVDSITDYISWNLQNNSVQYRECNNDEDIFGHTNSQEETLNAENHLKVDGNTLKLLRTDIAKLKTQVTTLWNNMNQESFKCDLPEINDKIKSAILTNVAVDAKIKKALDTYDADKLALYDYAAEYAGGEIISFPNTTPFPTNKIMQIFGFLRLSYSSPPNEIIKPSTIPGDCFKVYGQEARIIIKLGKKISIGSVSMEHSPLVEDFQDAPKNFNVFGLKDATGTKKSLLGSFMYDISKKESIQNFPINTWMLSYNQFDYVELQILSNHGNPDFTSIYRFRVHGARLMKKN